MHEILICIISVIAIAINILILLRAKKEDCTAKSNLKVGSSGSISPACQNCLNFQSSSGIDYRWIPCSNGGCSPCGTEGGYRTPSECLSNPEGLPLADCENVCYPPCDQCTASDCTDPVNCLRLPPSQT